MHSSPLLLTAFVLIHAGGGLQAIGPPVKYPMESLNFETVAERFKQSAALID
jgi:hypothetical protein